MREYRKKIRGEKTTTVAKGDERRITDMKGPSESPPPLLALRRKFTQNNPPRQIQMYRKRHKSFVSPLKRYESQDLCVKADVGITALFSPDCLSRGRGPWHDIAH